MSVRTAELLVLHPGPSRRLTLTGKTTVGGRDDCDLRLFDPGVEPLHAVVAPVDGEWVLRNASYRPCRVNDQAVVETILADRDVIQLGGVTLGFSLIKEDVKPEPVPSAVASLQFLRENVVAERAMLAEERSQWEAELERRRAALVEREKSFRDRASRTARAVLRQRERVQKQQKKNEQRAAELDKLANKVAEQQKAIDLANQQLRIEEHHADAKHRQIERRRAVVGADADAVATRLTVQKKELRRLDLEIERRRKDLELYAAPGAVAKGKTLIEREFAAAALERDAKTLILELETVFHDFDGLLTRLERRSAVEESAPRRPILRIASVDDAQSPSVLPMIVPGVEVTESAKVNLVAWADELRQGTSAKEWWDVRQFEFQRAVRAWRDEKQALLAELHQKHHALDAAKAALSERELRVARESARERMAVHREREAVDRRRTWLDRAQQRFAALQTAALEARLTPMEIESISAAQMIEKMKATEELWRQFRCDVLRERMDLACERERWQVRDHELVQLRRLAHKQRWLLAAIVSDQSVRDRLWNCERRLREAAALERETAIEKLAFSLVEEERVVSKGASVKQPHRKAA